MAQLIRFSGTCDFDTNAALERWSSAAKGSPRNDPLIDTSAWIEQRRRGGDVEVRREVLYSDLSSDLATGNRPETGLFVQELGPRQTSRSPRLD